MLKIFADGANLHDILKLNKDEKISGFTTNPTLMKKAGIKNYEEFAKTVLKEINDKPISFEVFSDDFESMKREALIINSWADNVYVKIPVMNTKRENSYDLLDELSSEGIKVNVTAVFTIDQVENIAKSLKKNIPSVVSVFAGRIADTGIDPVPIMKKSLEILKPLSLSELLWASPREVLNVYQASEINCDIITATPDLISKLDLKDKNLMDYSQETVNMFYQDSINAGFKI